MRLAAAVDDARLVLTDGMGPMDEDRAAVLACLEFMGIETGLRQYTRRYRRHPLRRHRRLHRPHRTHWAMPRFGRPHAHWTNECAPRSASPVAPPSKESCSATACWPSSPSAANAIDAALACARACDGTGLQLHLGLHAGDVIREQNNVFGGAVNIASRISALSAPGEVLVSDTVAELARTSRRRDLRGSRASTR